MYISVKEAAEKWGISDRRVRILCSEGKIHGAIIEGKTWEIPFNANEPPRPKGRGIASLTTRTIFAFPSLCFQQNSNSG